MKSFRVGALLLIAGCIAESGTSTDTSLGSDKDAAGVELDFAPGDAAQAITLVCEETACSGHLTFDITIPFFTRLSFQSQRQVRVLPLVRVSGLPDNSSGIEVGMRNSNIANSGIVQIPRFEGRLRLELRQTDVWPMDLRWIKMSVEASWDRATDGNAAPEITLPTGALQAVAGRPFETTFTVTDADQDEIEVYVDAQSQYPDLTTTASENGVYTVRFTVPASARNEIRLPIVASDAVEVVHTNLVIAIGPNQAPTLIIRDGAGEIGSSYTMKGGTTLALDVVATDANTDAVTVTGRRNGAEVTLIDSGAGAYRFAMDTRSSIGGDWTFEFIATDGLDITRKTVSVHAQQCQCTSSYGCHWEGGGCNYYGCWEAGGGCDGAQTWQGCWTTGYKCEADGCFQLGGGCNYYGCWEPGERRCDLNANSHCDRGVESFPSAECISR